jgi:hypothetical protein
MAAALGDAQICGFSGNMDLYGVGIRVGLYLQWIATLLTTLFRPGDEDPIRVVNLLIQSAIFIGLILLTGRHQLNPVEPVITIWLLFGALSSLTGGGINPLGRFSGGYRVLLYSGIAGYACWFWFSGLDNMLLSKPRCSTVAFFGNVSITGPFRTFNKVASVIGLAVCVVFIGVDVAVLLGLWGMRESEKPSRPRAQIELTFMSAVIIVVSMAAVEYLIKTNQITGVNDILSVGQTIPLFAGIFGLLELIMTLLRKGLLFQERCWVLFKRHLS